MINGYSNGARNKYNLFPYGGVYGSGGHMMNGYLMVGMDHNTMVMMVGQENI